MSVRKVGFVGIRVPDLAAFRHVFEEGLGLLPVQSGTDQVRYHLSDGTRFEGYGPGDDFHGFFKAGPVVGFEVEEFDPTWSRLLDLGIAPLSDIQDEAGQRWVHFRLPDGTVAELIGASSGARVAAEEP